MSLNSLSARSAISILQEDFKAEELAHPMKTNGENGHENTPDRNLNINLDVQTNFSRRKRSFESNKAHLESESSPEPHDCMTVINSVNDPLTEAKADISPSQYGCKPHRSPYKPPLKSVIVDNGNCYDNELTTNTFQIEYDNEKLSQITKLKYHIKNSSDRCANIIFSSQLDIWGLFYVSVICGDVSCAGLRLRHQQKYRVVNPRGFPSHQLETSPLSATAEILLESDDSGLFALEALPELQSVWSLASCNSIIGTFGIGSTKEISDRPHIEIPPDWSEAFKISDEQIKIAIMAKHNSGQSTFTRLLCNSLCNKFENVYLLSLDLSNPCIGIYSTIGFYKVIQPLFFPAFALHKEARPIKIYHIGSNTTGIDDTLLSEILHDITKMISQLQTMNGFRLVIDVGNLQKKTDTHLSKQILKACEVQHTFVLSTSSDLASLSVDGIQQPSGSQKIAAFLSRSDVKAGLLPIADVVRLGVITEIHQNSMHIWNFHPLSLQPPWSIPFSGSSGILGVTFNLLPSALLKTMSSENIVKAINATIVAVVEYYGNDAENQQKKLSYNDNTDNKPTLYQIPRLRLDTKKFLGFALVHGFDLSRGVIFLQTKVDIGSLKSRKILLERGQIPTPLHLLAPSAQCRLSAGLFTPYLALSIPQGPGAQPRRVRHNIKRSRTLNGG